MSALADPFIRYVLAQDGKFADDTYRDIEEGWSFNPARIPGTVALLFRMHKLGAQDTFMEVYWSTLAEYLRERPDDAVEAMQVLAECAGQFLSAKQTPITVLLSELENDGDWTSPESDNELQSPALLGPFFDSRR